MQYLEREEKLNKDSCALKLEIKHSTRQRNDRDKWQRLEMHSVKNKLELVIIEESIFLLTWA